MLLPRLLAAAALTAALTACSADGAAPAAAPATPTGATTEARLTGTAPTEPVSSPQPAAARLAAVPAAGTVSLGTGPFDDRFSLQTPSLRGGTVRTALTVTSDVSELIVLEAQSDFYDATGALLGSVRAQHEDEHGTGEVHDGEEAVELEMTAPDAWSARVHSAVLSVPVLVNE